MNSVLASVAIGVVVGVPTGQMTSWLWRTNKLLAGVVFLSGIVVAGILASYLFTDWSALSG